MKLTVVFVSFFILISCQPDDTRKTSTTSDKKVNEEKKVSDPDSVEIPEIPFDSFQYADEIDSRVKKNEGVVSRFSWYSEKKLLTAWKGPNQGEDEVFYIYQDSLSHILSVSIFPLSQSGDWFEYETYIFDSLGRTIKHTFHHSTFVSECGEARLNIQRWFDKEFLQLKEEREQLDFEEKKIEGSDCFPNMKIITAANLKELSKRDGLGKALLRVHK